jgi:hypothetical protein
MCGYRPACPCPWRRCGCGLPVVVAVELPTLAVTLPSADTVMVVPVIRGSANDPAGRLAVWKLADGHLACRDLAGGETPGEGEWRGTEHACDAEPAVA